MAPWRALERRLSTSTLDIGSPLLLSSSAKVATRDASSRRPTRSHPANPTSSKYLLEAAGIGIVPFQAFGYAGDSGWFRLSVGAVSMRDIQDALPRVGEALRALV